MEMCLLNRRGYQRWKGFDCQGIILYFLKLWKDKKLLIWIFISLSTSMNSTKTRLKKGLKDKRGYALPSSGIFFFLIHLSIPENEGMADPWELLPFFSSKIALKEHEGWSMGTEAGIQWQVPKIRPSNDMNVRLALWVLNREPLIVNKRYEWKGLSHAEKIWGKRQEKHGSNPFLSSFLLHSINHQIMHQRKGLIWVMKESDSFHAWEPASVLTDGLSISESRGGALIDQPSRKLWRSQVPRLRDLFCTFWHASAWHAFDQHFFSYLACQAWSSQ